MFVIQDNLDKYYFKKTTGKIHYWTKTLDNAYVFRTEKQAKDFVSGLIGEVTILEVKNGS